MSIRVATLNVWALPDPLTRHRDARIRAIGQAAGSLEADLIGFQEVWVESARRELVGALARAGLGHVWHPQATLSGGGLLIGSRWPLGEVHFEAYEARGFAERFQHMDYYAGKGFAHARVETPEGPVVFANTHLHANYAKPQEVDDYVGIRAAQVIQLADGLSGLSDPVVAVGDFNIADDEDAYRLIGGLTGLVDTAVELTQREATSRSDNPYRAPHRFDRRIDYVFHRGGARQRLLPRHIRRVFDEPVEIEGRPGAYSDHAGLFVEFDRTIAAADERQNHRPRRGALQVGARLIERGRAISRDRQRAQRTAASGGALAAVASASGARRTRRRFLRGALRLTAGLGTGFMFANGWQSEWMHRNEIAGLEQAERRLATLRQQRENSARGSLDG